MRDPYSILGVSKNADQKEIKAAWRATAKALHPDQNPDDPKAVNRFTEAGRAYDLLKNPDKRRLFDEAAARSAAKRPAKEQTFMEQRAERARAEAEAKAAALARAAAEARAAAAAAAVDAKNAAAQASGKDNAEDMVSKIFGAAKPTEQPKAQPENQAQETAAKAAEQSTAAAERAPDKAKAPDSQPHEAHSSPARELMAYLLKRLTRQVPSPEKAPDLNMDVSVSIEDLLARVNPAVTMPDGKLLSIPLPDAVTEGTQIRVEGYGHRLPNLKRGDVVATIRIKPHRWYRVDGYDLRTPVEIDIDKAVLGGEVAVETPQGVQKVTIPPWTGSQYTARIANRGLPSGAAGRGDLIAEMRVMLWDHPDQKLVDLMRSLRDGLYL